MSFVPINYLTIWLAVFLWWSFSSALFGFNLSNLEPNESVSRSDRQKALNHYDSVGRSLAFQKPDSAIFFLNQAIAIATELEDWKSIQKCYSNIAVIFQATGRIDTAMHFVKKAEQLYSLAGDSVQYGPLMMVKGNLMSMRGKTDSALTSYQHALQHYIQTEQLERAAGAASNIAQTYESKGYFNLATEAIYYALDYHKQSGTTKENPQLWNTLGNIHNSQFKYAEALKAYRKTYQIALNQNTLEGIAISASNLANSYNKLGEPDSTIQFIEIARDYATQVNNMYTLYMCDRIEAQAHELRGDYATGRKVLQKAIVTGKDKVPKGLYANLFQTLIGLQLKDESVSDSEIAETLAAFREVGIENLPVTYQCEFHKLSGYYLERTEDYKNALESFKLYRMLQDSIWNIEKTNRINELNIQFESLKKDSELDLLKEQQLRSSIQIANQRSIMFGIGGGSALLAGFGLAGFFLYRQRQRNKMLHESIASRDFERNRLSRELHDGVASELYGVQMAIDSGLYTNDATALNQQLSRIREDVRHISHDLAMPDIRHTSLPEMAGYLIDRWRHVGRKVEISINPPENEIWQIPPEKALHLYRILQEGLTNALRYSREDREVMVQLVKGGQSLKLEITNHYIETLVGESTPGIGLKNLQERAELIGGTAVVEMNNGLARLLVKIPLN